VQPYGAQPAYPYGGAPSPYAGRGGTNGSALTLVIVSVVLVLFCGGLFLIPAAVLGAVGLAKQSSDPAGAARMARYGWIAFAVGVVATLVALGVVLALILGAGSGFAPAPGSY
jgi:hypothetical protein